MDPERFDRIARRMGGGSSRRGMLGGASRRSLLQRLSALPLGGGFASLVAAADAKKGKGNGNGGSGKNDDDNEVAADKNKAKRRNKQCKKKKAKACDGRCGTVTVKCKKRNGKTKRTQVNCGSCACDPPCGPCATCTAARQCEPCEPCCEEVCCDQANAVCHAETGACCDPDSKAQTCDGRCGEVTNNCGFPVDCGPCTCGGGCPQCQVCNEHAGDCVPDPGQAGDPCGEPGQVCQANGSCACEAGTCPDCTTCANDGICTACRDCCDVDGICQSGTTNAACGKNGESCDVCTGQEACENQECVCVPDCDGKVCGPDGCGDQCGPGCDACATCQPNGTCSDPCGGSGCCAGTTCEQGDGNATCGTGGAACVSCTLPETCGGGNPGTPGVCGCTPTNPCTVGVCGTVPNNCGQNVDCGGCDNPTPICVNHVCTACDGTNPCPGTQCCSGGQCVVDCPACQSCSAGVCAPCADCCADDTCQAGDTWAQCGTGGGLCTECARGEVCASGSQTCGDCESGFRQRGTFCEIRNDFAKFQCAPNCACGAHVGGGPGDCWNVSSDAYCSSSQPICEFAADCVIEGLGDFCVPLGDCETGCIQTACVTRCGTGADDGPPRLVVLD